MSTWGNHQVSRSTANSNSYTLNSYAVAAGNNRVLAVIVSAMRGTEGGAAVTGVTFGAANLVEAGASTDTSTSRSYYVGVWYLINPSVSTADITVSLGASMMGAIVSAVTLYDVDQTTPVADTDTDTTTADTLSFTIAGDLALQAVCSNAANNPTWDWTTGTELYDLNNGSSSASEIAGSAIVTVPAANATATRSATPPRIVGVAVGFTATVASQEIAPSGGAMAAAGGGPTVWNRTIIRQVATGNDDARETLASGVVSLTNISLPANLDHRGGMIFRALWIPPGAGVSAAHIEVKPEADYGDSPGLSLAGEIDPADFTTTAYDLSDRTLTDETVNWTAADIGYDAYKSSPDISPIIEEIVHDEAWTPGGDIGVFLTDNGTGGALFAHSFNYSSGIYAPRLVIEWAFGLISPAGGAAEGAGGVAEVQPGQVVIEPTGAAAEGAGGVAEVQPGQVVIEPTGAVAEGAGGAAEVQPGQAVIEPTGSAAEGAGGVAVLERGQVVIEPTGGAAEGAGGTATIAQALVLYPAGGTAEAAGGGPEVERGQAVIAPSGGAMAAAGGVARLGVTVMPEGGAAEGAGGGPVVERGQAVIAPAGGAMAAAGGEQRIWNLRVIVAVTQAGRENSNGVMFLGDSAININNNGWAAFGTAALGIPAEAGITIQDARLWVWPTTGTADEPRLTLTCELAAWPAALGSAAGNISSRTPTPAVAQWRAENIGQGAHRPSANFAPSVKQVIDLPGWSPEAGLMVLLHDDGSGGWLRCYSDDAGSTYRPYAVIDWGFGALANTIEPASGVADAAGGAVVIERGQMLIEPAGGAAELAGGVADVERGQVVIGPVGAAADGAGGAAVIERGQVVIEPVGAAAEAAGGAAMISIALLVIPAGGAGEVIGGAAVIERGQVVIEPAGAAAEAIGGAAVVLAARFVRPAGVAGGVAGGGPVVERGQVVIEPGGAGAEGAGGAPALVLVIEPAGGTAEAAGGAPALVLVIEPVGAAAETAGGAPALVIGAAVIAPAGGAAGPEIGPAALIQTRLVRPAGGGMEAAGGAPALIAGTRIIAPVGGSMSVLFGLVMVALLRQTSPLTVRARGNGLSVEARGNGLSIRPRGNCLTLEEER